VNPDYVIINDGSGPAVLQEKKQYRPFMFTYEILTLKARFYENVLKCVKILLFLFKKVTTYGRIQKLIRNEFRKVINGDELASWSRSRNK